MKMLKTKLFSTVAAVVAMLGFAVPASATTIQTSGGGTAVAQGAFDSFALTVIGWVNGPLGIGIAIAAMIIGAAVGIMKSTAMPALVGIGAAAFFAWGPGIVVDMLQDSSTSGLI